MVESGLIDPDERIELINGEIIDMGSEGEAHWSARAKLVNWLLRRLPESIMLAPDGPLRLSAENEPEPDFYLYAGDMNVTPISERFGSSARRRRRQPMTWTDPRPAKHGRHSNGRCWRGAARQASTRSRQLRLSKRQERA